MAVLPLLFEKMGIVLEEREVLINIISRCCSTYNPAACFSVGQRTFWPKKPVVRLQSTFFEKLIFEHVLNVRKVKRTATFDGLEPLHFEDITGIVAPKIGPKSFGMS